MHAWLPLGAGVAFIRQVLSHLHHLPDQFLTLELTPLLPHHLVQPFTSAIPVHLPQVMATLLPLLLDIINLSYYYNKKQLRDAIVHKLPPLLLLFFFCNNTSCIMSIFLVA